MLMSDDGMGKGTLPCPVLPREPIIHVTLPWLMDDLLLVCARSVPPPAAADGHSKQRILAWHDQRGHHGPSATPFSRAMQCSSVLHHPSSPAGWIAVLLLLLRTLFFRVRWRWLRTPWDGGTQNIQHSTNSRC
jgi:hypothetical protein